MISKSAEYGIWSAGQWFKSAIPCRQHTDSFRNFVPMVYDTQSNLSAAAKTRPPWGSIINEREKVKICYGIIPTFSRKNSICTFNHDLCKVVHCITFASTRVWGLKFHKGQT